MVAWFHIVIWELGPLNDPRLGCILVCRMMLTWLPTILINTCQYPVHWSDPPSKSGNQRVSPHRDPYYNCEKFYADCDKARGDHSTHVTRHPITSRMHPFFRSVLVSKSLSQFRFWAPPLSPTTFQTRGRGMSKGKSWVVIPQRDPKKKPRHCPLYTATVFFTGKSGESFLCCLVGWSHADIGEWSPKKSHVTSKIPLPEGTWPARNHPVQPTEEVVDGTEALMKSCSENLALNWETGK